MKKFKSNWEIQHNWQLLFPVLGLLGLFYSSFRLSRLILGDLNIWMTAALTLIIVFALLKFILFIFKKLENKWVVNHRWEMIRIFIVFSITGSSSLFVGRPVIKLLGITPDNLISPVYWILYIFIGLLFYQIMLVFFGWLFGQFEFFWNFEKKMLRRFGLGRFID